MNDPFQIVDAVLSESQKFMTLALTTIAIVKAVTGFLKKPPIMLMSITRPPSSARPSASP